ncbi:hypothetical protein Q4610_11135 [Sphingobium sp. HBC34]|uniref:TetR family transcriptional regulator n=1 Tax=Sphingobium cyanobacteriorum TaxID=3063954 RepID=A0ABT8ZN35_9SPHN|nr:hypothetical protein [Sphingobium sp. HBC34]MDO7835597.1 hypothetical protein [Sphingobium sp. HBC34]
MRDDPFQTAILAAWHGEIFGAELGRLGPMLLADGISHTDSFAQIGQVEALMAQILYPALTPSPDISAAHKAASDRATSLLKDCGNWQGFLARSTASFPAALERFRQIVRIAPARHRPLAELLLAHEIALIDFMDRDAHRVPMPSGNALAHFVEKAAALAPRS